MIWGTPNHPKWDHCIENHGDLLIPQVPRCWKGTWHRAAWYYQIFFGGNIIEPYWTLDHWGLYSFIWDLCYIPGLILPDSYILTAWFWKPPGCLVLMRSWSECLTRLHATFFWLAVPLIFDVFLLGNLPVGKSMEGTVLSPLLERQPNLGDSKICKDISRHMSPGCPGSIFMLWQK